MSTRTGLETKTAKSHVTRATYNSLNVLTLHFIRNRFYWHIQSHGIRHHYNIHHYYRFIIDAVPVRVPLLCFLAHQNVGKQMMKTKAVKRKRRAGV